MTDPITRRRVPRTTIASGWDGADPVTAATPDHALLAQHQLSVVCAAAPGAGTVTLYTRPIQSSVFVWTGTVDIASGSGRLLFSGIFEAVKLTCSAALATTMTAQLDSLGDDFMLSGPPGAAGPPGPPGTQVNADWDATSGVAEILNKPTIPDTTSIPAKTITANYTLTDADGGYRLRVNSAVAVTITDPGTLTPNKVILVQQIGTGQPTIAGPNVQSFAATTKLAGQRAMATIVIDSSTVTYVNGELAAS